MCKTKSADDFTVAFLKEKLKGLGLITAGVKLFLRIMEANSTGTWMSNMVSKTARSDR